MQLQKKKKDLRNPNYKERIKDDPWLGSRWNVTGMMDSFNLLSSFCGGFEGGKHWFRRVLTFRMLGEMLLL